jgi:hypothetical protein
MLTYLLMLVLLAGASTARGQVSAQGASDPSVAQEASSSTTGTKSNLRKLAERRSQGQL